MTYFKTKDKVASGQRLLSYRAFLGIKKPLSISSLALKLINICQTLDKIKKVQLCLAQKKHGSFEIENQNHYFKIHVAFVKELSQFSSISFVVLDYFHELLLGHNLCY